MAATSSEADAALMGWAGTPTAVASEGMSSITTAPAPMIDSQPSVTFGMTVAPIPMNTPGSTLTESAVKQFNKRVKGTEQFWSLPGVVSAGGQNGPVKGR